jgi:hypothetical protein
VKEIVYHSLGLCGESHPSILSILALGLTPVIFMYKKVINYVKKIFIH